jgi:hypothetical protein
LAFGQAWSCIVQFPLWRWWQVAFSSKQLNPVKIELTLLRIFVDKPFAGFAPYLSLEHLYLLFQLADGLIFFLELFLVRGSFCCEVFEAGKLAPLSLDVSR